MENIEFDMYDAIMNTSIKKMSQLNIQAILLLKGYTSAEIRSLLDKAIVINKTLHPVIATDLYELNKFYKAAYQTEKENREKAKNKEHRKDQIEEFDLVIKKWTYKSRYLPYIASLLALTISIASYFKPEKKQIDSQPMQIEIQQTKEQMKKQDSLFQDYIRQKKDSL